MNLTRSAESCFSILAFPSFRATCPRTLRHRITSRISNQKRFAGLICSELRSVPFPPPTLEAGNNQHSCFNSLLDPRITLLTCNCWAIPYWPSGTRHLLVRKLNLTLFGVSPDALRSYSTKCTFLLLLPSTSKLSCSKFRLFRRVPFDSELVGRPQSNYVKGNVSTVRYHNHVGARVSYTICLIRVCLCR